MIAAAFQCRDRSGYWTREVFSERACDSCYRYLFPSATVPEISLFRNRSVGWDVDAWQIDVTDVNVTSQMCSHLKPEECEGWRACCLSAQICCQRQQEFESRQVTGAGCPMTWDGYACWSATASGQEVTTDCPAYIPHAMPSVSAYKLCTNNGTWYREPRRLLEWTNYTTCLDLQRYKTEVYISLGCNVASILLLAPGLIIFISVRLLRKQHRIRLHVQLMMAFLLNAMVNVLWETLVVYDRMTKPPAATRIYQNLRGCKFLYFLTRYSRSTIYIWMFFEGLYLHRLIVKAFQPPKTLVPFYLLGWVFPCIPVGTYTAIKVAYADESCWIKNYGLWEWMIYTPNLVSLVANLFFLMDILRILLTQLQTHPNEPSSYRRALKATAVLIPLFGLQLFAVIYRPPFTAPGAVLYERAAAFIINSQGFFVALILCFLNGEVISHLKGCTAKISIARRCLPKRQSLTTQVSEFARTGSARCHMMRGGQAQQIPQANYMLMTNLN